MKPFKRPMKGVALLPPDVEATDDNIYEAMCKLREWPVLATEKMDGIRGLKLMYNQLPRLLSYRLKLIPNSWCQNAGIFIPMGYDMEIWTPELEYNDIQSIVMSEQHPDEYKLQFHIIDIVSDEPYLERLERIKSEQKYWRPYIKFTPPTMCNDAHELMEFYKSVEHRGGEGICFRTPNSPYKQGRSTLREQYLIKLCPWSYEETTIIGFEEQQENTNDEKRNNIGLMDRSKTLSGQAGKGTLGAFVCSDGFNIGTGVGLTDRLRQKIWDNQSKYLGRSIKYKTKAHGKKDLPRSPIFWGFRDTTID